MEAAMGEGEEGRVLAEMEDVVDSQLWAGTDNLALDEGSLWMITSPSTMSKPRHNEST